MIKSFTAWLDTKKSKDTRIGDLARDAQVDRSWPQEATTKAEFLHHLKEVKACDEAIETLNLAWAAYQRTKRGSK
jgi:hypothetical protein